MDIETLLALVALAFTAAWTPGPNNALVAASGANFGLKRTVPHVMGITLGFPLMIFVVGLFLGELFQRFTPLREILRWGGAALLLYIAWKIAISGGLGAGNSRQRPFTFTEAAAFQWINPKGWAMAIAVTAQFVSPDRQITSALLVALVFVVAGLSSATSWAVAGRALTRWINTANRLRRFNIATALLIAATVVLLFLD